jgi:glycosyltransferase involved in cell wall biosynthesis
VRQLFDDERCGYLAIAGEQPARRSTIPLVGKTYSGLNIAGVEIVALASIGEREESGRITTNDGALHVAAPKAILYLSHYHGLGGAEKSLLILLDGLDREKYEPIVVVPRRGLLEDSLRQRGILVHVVPAYMYYWPRPVWKLALKAAIMLLQSPVVVYRLFRIASAHKVALIHVNSLANPFGAILTRFYRVPLFWHVRDIYGGLSARLYSWLLTKVADETICITEAVADSLRLKNPLVVYNGIQIRPRTAGRERGAKFFIGCLSKLEPMKGQDDLLRAVAHLLPQYPEIRCVIAGDDPTPGQSWRIYLKKLAGELGVSNAVEFTGFMMDVTEVYARLDLFVLTSWAEPMGRVLLEAMNAGVPIVASCGGGVREVLEDGRSALLYNPRRVDELVERIRTILRDPLLGARLSEYAYSSLVSQFADSKYCADIQQLYVSAFDGGKRSR